MHHDPEGRGELSQSPEPGDEVWTVVGRRAEAVTRANSPWEAYDAAMEAAGEASALLDSDAGAADVYVMWADLTDLFDNPLLGRVPEEGAHVVLKMAAQEWLAATQNDRAALLAKWRNVSLLDLVRAQGYEIGPPANPAREDPWRGHWSTIEWVVGEIGKTHSVYAAAQRVISECGDDPTLQEAGRTRHLAQLLRAWSSQKEQRSVIEDEIRQTLVGLRAEQVPALE